jgi:hypothetical protein
MAPSFNPDSAEVSEIILPDGSTASEVIAPDGSTVFGNAIPDSVASRPDDDSSGSVSADHGLAIEFAESFGEFGARISNNTTGVTTARVRDSNGNVIDSTDVSSLSSGDAFTLSGDFQANTEYQVTVDADGSSFTVGFASGADQYPYTSADVDIVGRVVGTNTQSGNKENAHALNDVGDVGFS